MDMIGGILLCIAVVGFGVALWVSPSRDEIEGLEGHLWTVYTALIVISSVVVLVVGLDILGLGS